MKVWRAFATLMLVLVPTLAAHATDEIFSPALPAKGAQFLQCSIVNVSDRTQTVTIQGFDGNGVPATGPVTQTLGPGAAGGFSVSATAGVAYCKFTVERLAKDFRAAIEIIDSAATPPVIVVALPAF